MKGILFPSQVTALAALTAVVLMGPAGAQTLTVSDVVVKEGGTATVTLELSSPVDFAIRYT